MWVLEMCKMWVPFLGQSLLLCTIVLNNTFNFKKLNSEISGLSVGCAGQRNNVPNFSLYTKQSIFKLTLAVVVGFLVHTSYNVRDHISCLISALWLHHIICMSWYAVIG